MIRQLPLGNGFHVDGQARATLPQLSSMLGVRALILAKRALTPNM